MSEEKTMGSKRKKWLIAIQYSVAALLVILFLSVILLATYNGVWMDKLSGVASTPNPFLAFHVSVLYFLHSYYLFILTGIIFLIVIFEIKYSLPNKTKFRFIALVLTVLILNIFTITYLLAIIQMMFTSICPSDTGNILSDNPQFGTKETKVPRQFRYAVGWEGHGGDYNRYVDAYSSGYWSCIENHVKNINYVSKESDYICNGHGAAISGYSAGYSDAEKEIKWNIKKFGKEKTHKYITEWWKGI